MHRLLGTFVLLVSLSASAEVVAGRTHIFFHDAWTPIAGGPLTSLGRPIESVDSDGERFLAAWRDPNGVRLGLFEEGAITPVAEVALEAAPGKTFVRWDGTRYVVVVASEPAQLAIVSRQGVVELRTTIPDTRAIVDVAASPSGIALMALYPTDTHTGVVDVLLLGIRYRVARRTTVGSILRSDRSGGTYIRTEAIVPFGNGFYAVWHEGRAGRWDDMVGTRVLLDGSAPDVVPSRWELRSVTGTLLDHPQYNLPSAYAVVLHRFGSRLAMTSLRSYGSGVVTTFIEPDGKLTHSPRRMSVLLLPETTRTVKLLDGSIVVVWAENGVATVKTLFGVGPRRRSARH